MPTILRGIGAVAVAAGVAVAQGSDIDRIQLGVVLSPRTVTAMGVESDALRRAIEVALAARGMGTAVPDLSTRFVAYVDMVPLQEEMVTGGMTAVSEQLSVTFGDRAGGRAMGSFQTVARAVGKSKEAALRNLSTALGLADKPGWTSALDAANAAIIDFFERQCDALIREAEAKVKQQEFDAAIYLTTSVPREATRCHQQAMTFAGTAYTAKLRAQCAQPFAQARARWAASKSRANAMVVAEILGTIPADSPCFRESSSILTNVAGYIAAYDSQAAKERLDRIEFLKKQYEDRLAFARERMQGRNALTAAAIEAARQVGMEQAKAYAKAGPAKTTQTLIFR